MSDESSETPSSTQDPSTTDPSTPPPRSIEIEIEVPGTPEEVWAAIATGAGVTSWYVPHEIEDRIGGAANASFGPGMEANGKIAAWDPPHRFAIEGETPGVGLAFEWTIETASADTCIVRLVNSGFGDGEDWDAQYDAMSNGWAIFLTNLRLHLEYFAPATARASIPMAVWPLAQAEAWQRLTDHLDIPAQVEPGDRITVSGDGAPHLSGVVVKSDAYGYTLLVDAPAPGTGFITAEAHGPMTAVSIWTYLYGPEGAEAAGTDEARWRTWLEATGSPSD